ncbi:MAG: SDR family oxidoreductase [Actinobacteria bacterium]|nr:SDR family oxidoreductase [Actinomycetota bacterium]
MNQIDLQGRSAVVTGGASGLSRAAVARMLISGAQVMIWDIYQELLDEASAVLKELGTVHTAVVNVSDYDAVTAAAAEAESVLGQIDILVNGAGISCAPTPIGRFKIDDWLKIVNVDLSGVFYCCRAIVPGMIERGYGRVINVTSMAGKEGGAEQTAYAAAKAGVIGLTKSLGQEGARSGVMVNAIAPGVFNTRMHTSAATDELVAQLMEKTPARRPGTDEEFASMVAWMASEDCSYTSGFTFDISGGRGTY